jgi:hypothetical protein
MTRAPQVVAVALIPLVVGCEATLPPLPPLPPIPHDPAGPCLQLHFFSQGRASYWTLWRGETLLGHNMEGDEIDAPLRSATADNPEAAREARAYHRSNVAWKTIFFAGFPMSAAVAEAGTLWARQSHESAPTPFWLGGAVLAAAAMITTFVLNADVGPTHVMNAVHIYNADPPPDCPAPAPGAAIEASE